MITDEPEYGDRGRAAEGGEIWYARGDDSGSRVLAGAPGAPPEPSGKLLDSGFPRKLNDGRIANGLYLKVDQGAAMITITVGRSDRGGIAETRTFVLTSQGVWTAVTGWENCRVEIINPSGIGYTVAPVRYAWTSDQPPQRQRVFLPTAVIAGSNPSPPGATGIFLAGADAGAAWSTNVGTVSTLPSVANLDGYRPRLGEVFMATVAQTCSWEIELW